MHPVKQNLKSWKEAQSKEIDVGSLFSRSHIAHKWKAPFRSISLREAVSWRTQDLLEQSVALYELKHILGARILLRSALEATATLIYLNQLTRKVLSGELDFHEYSVITTSLLLGSRDSSTPHKAINIVTVLEKCERRYQGISKLYAMLSESAHPNYEGLSVGYSSIDHENDFVVLKNKWLEMYSENHLDTVSAFIEVFMSEYNDEWSDAFEKLERWIEDNDEELEATKYNT